MSVNSFILKVSKLTVENIQIELKALNDMIFLYLSKNK
jgi:hypothetical protein